MRRDFRRLAWLAVAGALVFAATGCPDSDTLENGNYVLNYRTVATEDDGFECVLMDIKMILLRPNDGVCSDTGEPCFNDTDCVPNGECEGNLADDSIPGGELESVGGSKQGLQWANFTAQGEPCPTFEGQFESGDDFAFQNFDEGLYRRSSRKTATPSYVMDLRQTWPGVPTRLPTVTTCSSVSERTSPTPSGSSSTPGSSPLYWKATVWRTLDPPGTPIS